MIGGAGRPRAGAAALAAVSAAVYATLALLRLRTFRSGTYDLVIFDQAVRSYSRFHLPVAMVKGVHNGFGPDFSVLGDHFSPILALLAPLYWIHDGPGTLLAAQAVLLALAVLPIWAFAARRLGERAAGLLAAAYALSWPVAEAVAFDFHEAAFVPLLSALLVERHDAGRRGQAAAAAVLLLLVKEDMGLLVAGFGLVLLARRGARREGAAYAAAGLAWTAVASRLLIPAFGGREDYYWAYGSYGPDLPHAVLHLLTHPWEGFAGLADPPVKLWTMALLVLPFLLLPLASPLTLMVLPMLAERMLADRFANWWEPRYHYNAFLVAVLVMAAADALDRWGGRAPRLRGLAPPAMLAAAAATVPFFGFAQLWNPDLYHRSDRARAAAEAVARVPDGAVVEASNRLGPALSGRTGVLLLDHRPRGAPWVVADERVRQFPFATVDEQRARIAALVAAGYRQVFREGGYVVLHGPDTRGGPPLPG
ncbi:DUF2079 domain-containing protein [Actinomadura parmotrematis]|uniref:DUF2079 domain-containing protein n=1 Tax=Actinomadura parmotrematis TaxID=2864039 RepID=A0ABS7FVP9_9ACTN|nr:DUF2079 domain-containing protein [Actinomadura parmotrematis]MBW8484505.1 DUF2079 domain-containing protein [Actinomadura parmotrematis]